MKYSLNAPHLTVIYPSCFIYHYDIQKVVFTTFISLIPDLLLLMFLRMHSLRDLKDTVTMYVLCVMNTSVYVFYRIVVHPLKLLIACRDSS